MQLSPHRRRSGLSGTYARHRAADARPSTSIRPSARRSNATVCDGSKRRVTARMAGPLTSCWCRRTGWPSVSVPDSIWSSFQGDQLAQRSQAMLDGLSQKLTDAMTPSAPSSTTLAPSTGLPSLDALMSPFAPAARSLGARQRCVGQHLTTRHPHLTTRHPRTPQRPRPQPPPGCPRSRHCRRSAAWSRARCPLLRARRPARRRQFPGSQRSRAVRRPLQETGRGVRALPPSQRAIRTPDEFVEQMRQRCSSTPTSSAASARRPLARRGSPRSCRARPLPGASTRSTLTPRWPQRPSTWRGITRRTTATPGEGAGEPTTWARATSRSTGHNGLPETDK